MAKYLMIPTTWKQFVWFRLPCHSSYEIWMTVIFVSEKNMLYQFVAQLQNYWECNGNNIWIFQLTYLILMFSVSSNSSTFNVYVSPQIENRFGRLEENLIWVIWFLIAWWLLIFSPVFLMSYNCTWPDWFPITMLCSLFGDHSIHVGQLELSLYKSISKI